MGNRDRKQTDKKQKEMNYAYKSVLKVHYLYIW